MKRSARALLVALLAACAPADADVPGGIITGLVITPDPSGHAPLTAEAELTLSRPARVEVLVPGRKGRAAGRVLYRTREASRHVDVPILGLYPGRANTVTLRVIGADGEVLEETTCDIATPPLHAALPEIRIEVAERGRMKPGMNLVSYFGHDGEAKPQRPFVFDAAGEIRWYLDFTGHPLLEGLRYDNGPERLANGNLYFGDRGTGRVFEVDMLGRVVNSWEMAGYEFHHQVVEKPDGNFLVTVDERDAPTVEDVLVEIERASGEIVRTWDLKRSLAYGRRSWPTGFGDLDVDWFHANAVAFDPSDGAIIVSGRTQGTVKLTDDNEVVWILAPHLDWGTAGDGTDLSTRLLQPLDAHGRPIRDREVLEGRRNHPDFEWAWYQHAPELLPDGSLLLFDNGDFRNYSRDVEYSRAVVYEIDPVAMTVRQRWQYGKERGSETYSNIVSDVDYHEVEDNVLFVPGSVGPVHDAYGKVIEVSHATGDVVFEATIVAPEAPFGVVLHRAERLSLYPSR